MSHRRESWRYLLLIIWNYSPNINTFSETMSELNCDRSIYMCLNDHKWTNCLWAQFRWIGTFLQYSIVDRVIMSTAFSVFTHEIFANQVFASLCDCVPIGYQRYIEEHVSVED